MCWKDMALMNPLHRIVDANANRAREALRLMEDAARFALGDQDLIEGLKRLRHDLRHALDQPALDRSLLLSARDVESDRGLGIKTPSELTRAGVRDIAAAAGSRLAEALRSIEEAAKGLGADAAALERLRYRAYIEERRLLLALPTGRCPQWRLCVLITESLCTRPWLGVARAAIDGGADCIQLREKELPDRELLKRATALTEIVGSASVIINDRPDVALMANASGVHLGQEDLGIADVRGLVGSRMLIGVSTSNVDEARGAARGGADYCGIGPMFPTTTKEKPRISGPEYLREYLADPILSQRPHLAIGGITPENIGLLREAGCRGVAVSSVVCGADDPAGVCRRLITALGAAPARAEHLQCEP
jgi:thiamine-phosphate pyrophosphorylase